MLLKISQHPDKVKGIVVNADGEMLFYAGMIHDEATAPLRIDVTDSKSFNESMWPYL